MVFPQRYAHCQIQLKNKFSRHVGIAEIRPWVITIKVAKRSSSIFGWTLLFHFPPVFTLILPTLICFVFLQVHITLFLSVPLYQYNFYVLQFLVKTSGNKLVIWYEIWSEPGLSVVPLTTRLSTMSLATA